MIKVLNVLLESREKDLDQIIQKKDIDLIVLDLMLPNESGLDICKRVRVNKVNIPIIMLTAKGDEVDRIIGLEMGADDYLPNHLILVNYWQESIQFSEDLRWKQMRTS